MAPDYFSCFGGLVPPQLLVRLDNSAMNISIALAPRPPQLLLWLDTASNAYVTFDGGNANAKWNTNAERMVPPYTA
eukprot:892696-Pelagomonas_calceolata.AAC.17